jgi:hypothetical protein
LELDDHARGFHGVRKDLVEGHDGSSRFSTVEVREGHEELFERFSAGLDPVGGKVDGG